MADSDPTCIRFVCEAPPNHQWYSPGQATIEIEIGDPGVDYVGDTAFNAVVRLIAGKYSFSVECVLYGYEIRGFARNLRELSNSLDGSVRIQVWDGDTLLCFTVVNRGQGRIAVGGQFAPVRFDSPVTSADHFVADSPTQMQGVVVSFDGFFLDQTYLNAPLSVLELFVDEHRAECDATGGYRPRESP